MEYVCKKTNELSEDELRQITDLFNLVFEKEVTPDFMLSQYVNNPFGFAYHSIAMDEGKVIGLSSYVPAWFWYQDQKVVFVCGGDTMIAKEYRDGFIFWDVIKNAHKYLKTNGVVMNYGYPNDKSCPVLLKAKLTKRIGKMHTYVLPYRIGGIKSGLKCVNWLSMLGCRIWVSCSSLFASKKEHTFTIHKDNESYNPSRYQRFGGEYGFAKLKNGNCHYKVKEHEGVRTAFVLDVAPKSPRNYVDAVKHLLKLHSKEFDLILYPGELPFGVTGMIKLPRKVEPKNFNMTGNILDKKVLDEKVIYDIKNWDTNLSNYDLI